MMGVGKPCPVPLPRYLKKPFAGGKAGESSLTGRAEQQRYSPVACRTECSLFWEVAASCFFPFDVCGHAPCYLKTEEVSEFYIS